MRRHPDELVGRYRLPDTAAIRRHFERHSDTFEAALATYREWRLSAIGDPDDRARLATAIDRRARECGADPGDWRCVLRCAAARRDRGLPCPPWYEEELP